jgi:hypothetical protein
LPASSPEGAGTVNAQALLILKIPWLASNHQNAKRHAQHPRLKTAGGVEKSNPFYQNSGLKI